MNTEQSFINGFLKRAQAHGVEKGVASILYKQGFAGPGQQAPMGIGQQFMSGMKGVGSNIANRFQSAIGGFSPNKLMPNLSNVMNHPEQNSVLGSAGKGMWDATMAPMRLAGAVGNSAYQQFQGASDAISGTAHNLLHAGLQSQNDVNPLVKPMVTPQQRAQLHAPRPQQPAQAPQQPAQAPQQAPQQPAQAPQQAPQQGGGLSLGGAQPQGQNPLSLNGGKISLGLGGAQQAAPAPTASASVQSQPSAPASGQQDMMAQFRKYHGTNFDPHSARDRWNLQQMQQAQQHGQSVVRASNMQYPGGGGAQRPSAPMTRQPSPQMAGAPQQQAGLGPMHRMVY